MEKYITDERTGLQYELVGDYYLIAGDDDLEDDRPIGIWGQRRLQYINQYRKSLYARMAKEYESEQRELEQLLSESEEQLVKSEKHTVDMRMLLEGFREYTDMKELTPTIVNKLIQRIEVHNSDKSSGHIKVKVDIYFTAVGLVDIPTEQQLYKLMKEAASEFEGASKTA